MIFKSGRKASPLTSLLDIILLVLFAQMILTSQLTSNEATKKIEKAKNELLIEIQKRDEIIKNLTKQLDETRANYNKDITDKNDLIDRWKKALERRTEELEIADSKNEELEAKIASYSLIINSLEKNNRNLDIENISLKAEIINKKNENTKLLSENDDLKNKNTNLGKENDTLKDEIANKKEENTKLVSENNDLKNKNKGLDNENNSLKEEINKNKEENTKLLSENDDLKDKNKNLDSENNSLKEEITNKQEENKKLNDTNTKLKEEMVDNTEINVALNTQIEELKRFVEENSKDLNQVEGATKLVTVRKILTSAKALEQLKNIVTVVEILLYKDKMIIRLDDFEEKLNWPDDDELEKKEFDNKVVRDKGLELRNKLYSLFTKAKRGIKEQQILLIPSGDKNNLPSVCWKFFLSMKESSTFKDISFIKDVYMPDKYIHINIKEN